MGFTLICCKNKSSSSQQIDLDIPDKMVLIPSGVYYQDDLIKDSIQIPAFFMDETEITNRQFQKFVDATGYLSIAERPIDWDDFKTSLAPNAPKPPDSLLEAGSMVFRPTETPVSLSDHTQWWHWEIGANWKHPEGIESDINQRLDHPVVHIAYEDALAYAAWAGKRLPSEEEWEWAASAGNLQNRYPWGNEDINNKTQFANFWQGLFPFENRLEDGFANSAAIKSFPPNALGLYEMAGNVWEWSSSSVKSRDGSSLQVIKGGSYLCNDSYCAGYQISNRMKTTKDSAMNHLGFRCVRDIN